MLAGAFSSGWFYPNGFGNGCHLIACPSGSGGFSTSTFGNCCHLVDRSSGSGGFSTSTIRNAYHLIESSFCCGAGMHTGTRFMGADARCARHGGFFPHLGAALARILGRALWEQMRAVRATVVFFHFWFGRIFSEYL
jgi:hypothetical protein